MYVLQIDLDSMLDEIGFDAATEMGGSELEKVPEVSLVPETFWAPIFTSSNVGTCSEPKNQDRINKNRKASGEAYRKFKKSEENK